MAASRTATGRTPHSVHVYYLRAGDASRPVDFHALAARLRPLGDVRWNSMLLRFVWGSYTISVFADGRTVVQGTNEVPRARALYARFIGS